MTHLLVALLIAASPSPYGEDRPRAVSSDGSEVPIVVPGLTPSLVPILAPEFVADGGTEPDGGQTPIVARDTLSVYDINLPAEVAISAGTFGLYFMADFLVKPSLEGSTSCTHNPGSICSVSDLNPLDRYSVGRTSKTWSDVTDGLLVGTLMFPVLYLGFESLVLPTRHPWGDFFNDLTVVVESMALTAAMQSVLKFAFRRPRPDRYVASNIAPTADDELSFPSGHVSMVTAATTALTTTVFLRHPDSKVRYLVLAVGVALSLLTGVGRVESGQHFPTDCITGLLIGGFGGFVVPYLHRKNTQIRPVLSYNPITGSSVVGITGPW